MTIRNFIKTLRGTNVEIGEILGVSKGMVSHYRNSDRTPKIDVAKRVYNVYNVVLLPYSREALIGEDDARN